MTAPLIALALAASAWLTHTDNRNHNDDLDNEEGTP